MPELRLRSTRGRRQRVLRSMLMHLGEKDEARRRLSRSHDLYRQIGTLAKVRRWRAFMRAGWIRSRARRERCRIPPWLTAFPTQTSAQANPARFLQTASEALALEPAPDVLLTRLTTTILEQTEATRAVMLSRVKPQSSSPSKPNASETAHAASSTGNPQPLRNLAAWSARVLNYTVNTANRF